MVLARYLLSRFFTNLFAINIGLTFLYNLIEFFEKMVRAKAVSTDTVLYFIALNLIPSFFENLPVSSWLASCMTLKEMHQQNEWETLRLLNIRLSKVFSLLLIAGTCLVVFSFIGKEVVTNKISRAAEKFKMETFKQSSNTRLFNQWFTLKSGRFCHINYLDLATKKGDGFSLFELSDNFTIRKITTTKNFSIQPETKEVIITHGKTVLTQTKQQLPITNERLLLPSFFTQLHIKRESPPLSKLASILVLDRSTLPYHVYHTLLYLFLHRLLIHLLLLLYPLLTFGLFFLFPFHRFYKWILIFTPYPLVTILFTATDSLFQTIPHGLLAFLPYVIVSGFAALVYYSIRK